MPERESMQSISTNEIKKVKSLSQKKFRDELGLFVVEGEKLVGEALKSDFEVVNVYRRDEIGEDAMSRISLLKNPSPTLAVVRIPQHQHQFEALPCTGLVLGLDAIRDPGNLGTIIRIADWFGIKDVFTTFDTVDLYNPKVVQSTMGAIFRVRLHYCDLPSVARALLSLGGKVYGTFLDGRDIYSCPLETGENTPVMVVVGNEADGISSQMAATVNERLLIPAFHTDKNGLPSASEGVKGGCESLNAAVATAITLAEFRRRALAKD